MGEIEIICRIICTVNNFALLLFYQLRTTPQKIQTMNAVAPKITVQKFAAANNATCIIENAVWENCSSPKVTVCSLWEKFEKRRIYVDAVLCGNGKVFAKLGYICLQTNKFVMTADKVATRQMWAEFIEDVKFIAPAPAKKEICRRAIMVRAHEIARTLQGDRAACLSFALKQAWAEAKAA